MVESATRDLMEMEFGLGAYDAEECAEIFAMLRPLRVSALRLRRGLTRNRAPAKIARNVPLRSEP
ncbi:hypothetical protein STANM309S_00053 [Streptomyces tanashiensis]